MKETHREELKKTDVGVVATSKNEGGTAIWVKAFIGAKAKILRDFKKHPRPYFSILQRSSLVKTETLA